METQRPVIRTYSGADREAAKAAYEADVDTARSAGWIPVAHRWRADGDQHELAVIFELAAASSGTEATAGDEVTAPGSDVVPVEAGSVGTEDAASQHPSAENGASATSSPTSIGGSAARAHSRATLETIDLHAGGEPIRLIRSGYPRVPSAPILERRRWVQEHADGARRMLMYEPRGHDAPGRPVPRRHGADPPPSDTGRSLALA